MTHIPALSWCDVPVFGLLALAFHVVGKALDKPESDEYALCEKWRI